MWRRVDPVKWTDVLEERIASIFRVENHCARNQREQVAQSAATCSRWFIARRFFYPEDGDDTFLWNLGSFHWIYTTPHPRRRHSSYLPLFLSKCIPVIRDFMLKLSEFQLLLCCERDHFAIGLRHTVHQVSARESPGSHSDLKLVNRNCRRLLRVYTRWFI
jgi:hypothetical protein